MSRNHTNMVGNAKPLQTASEGSRAELPPPQTPDTTERLREPIARIIDPMAWLIDDDGYPVAQEKSDEALATADEILALVRSTLSQQQGEIERLREEVKALEGMCEAYESTIAALQARVTKLEGVKKCLETAAWRFDYLAKLFARDGDPALVAAVPSLIDAAAEARLALTERPST